MSEILLDIQNLRVGFRSDAGLRTVVESLCLNIRRGETLALVGESGSGKSVTAQSILKLLPEHSAVYESGVIAYGGDNLLASSENHLRRVRGKRISMIFQEPMTSLNPLHTIEKQLLEAVELHGAVAAGRGKAGREARIKPLLEWLDRVGIRNPEQKLKALPHELSGGERQRVMIAMALINEPELLIADEPTTALDVTVQAQILDLLKSLQQEMRMAVLFITHDLNIVRSFAERVAIMQSGQLLECGNTSLVFDQPQHEYTKMLLDAAPGDPPAPIVDNANPLLQVQNLNTWFPIRQGLFKRVIDHVKAVQDVNFSLSEGETIGVVGESGSGKTTIGRSILRLIESRGDVYYRDKRENLLTLSAKEILPLRKEIQIIFQDPYGSLSPRMSVGDIVAEGLMVHESLTKSDIDREVIEVLKKVRLDPAVRHRYPNEFSGGQRQRIAIARALILKPKLLVLDEPTSALDRSVQKDVIDLLKELQLAYAISYVFISHDLDVVRAISHKIVVMRAGQIVEAGRAEDIFLRPQHEYTKSLIASANVLL